MALIKLGALAQDVRGSLNGTTFSRNRGGAYVRSKVSPVQPVSGFADLARSIFAAVSQRWSGVLTDAQRAGWDAWSATHPFINVFGDAIILSGVAMYQAVNRRNGQIGEAYIDDAPASWTVEDIGTATIVITAAAGILTVFTIAVGRALEADEVLYIFATPPLIGARSVQNNDFRLLNTPTTGGGTLPFAHPAWLQTRFDPIIWVAGNRLAVRVQAINTVTGGSSAPVVANVIVS